MNGPPYLGEDVALFIDWENFKISLATGRRHPNVSALKEEVSNLGRVVVAKAYADWVTRAPELRGASQFINDPPALYAAGIEPVYVPTRLAYGGTASSPPGRTFRVKNSVDVKMTADCIECAHSYPNIGTYVLVSGDSDFIHVVNTLRTMGKRVVIIGVSWATSRRLADQVDGLILYDEDVDPVTPAETAAAGDGRGPSPGNAGRLELGEVVREIEECVRGERQAGGTPLLTSIKQRLMRRFPGFDEKKLGFSSFKKLMARTAQEGNIKLITAGLVDWATMADEVVPSDAPLPEPAVNGAPLVPARGRRRRSSRSTPRS
ncbi:MAG: NYN domain-containing protein, partial [Dehalococcoidia bacterium]|nr:NYN domain-containing protein [Dehalococcoidia bacterium]